ncbi:MAG: chemotaxis response regulator protein-glutamate methylesterase [Wenzhouxiangella sp.]|jgi:two-component system chemotaxis response regulator CheB|nr:chemotaxis response regulator protein-glutamate methylesterase [Wenzhouxiangella sp.]
MTLAGKKISVLIVDDSAVVRQVLTEMLAKDRAIEVIGAAPDPLFAMKKMETQWPDVIVLDIEMPRMDGITFLRKIMSERPTPVVICSTLTQKGAETTMQALSAGAVSIITKPRAGLKGFLQDSANDVATAVKAASRARMNNVRVSASASTPVETAHVAPVRSSMLKTTQQLVAIGTSTGGTQALEVVLTALPSMCPGIVIVQHMPERFTDMFAQRLNGLCKIQVREARDRDRVLPGLALIAPGGKHMKIERSGAHYITRVFDGPPVNRHKPSVDVLFKSVAEQAGKNSVGFILTGMGDDGARGLKQMRDAGAHTVAQDEKSCIVFGMPKEAIALGAADQIMGLHEVAAHIMRSATVDHL